MENVSLIIHVKERPSSIFCSVLVMDITLTITPDRNNVSLAHSLRQSAHPGRKHMAEQHVSWTEELVVVNDHVTGRLRSREKSRNLVTTVKYLSLETCFLWLLQDPQFPKTVPLPGKQVWYHHCDTITMMASQGH